MERRMDLTYFSLSNVETELHQLIYTLLHHNDNIQLESIQLSWPSNVI